MGRRMYLKGASKELGLSEWYLRTEIKCGRIPYLMAGNRYILDIEQVEEYLKNKAFENMKREDEPIKEGVLRKVKE